MTELKPPKQVLLVNLPTLSNAPAMKKMLDKIDQWISENKG